MSYFLLYRLEDGIRIKQFRNSDEVKKHLQDWFDDCNVTFLDYFPQDPYDFLENNILVIRGEVIKPKPITIVKTYDIE